jgi:protein TonB
MSYLEQTGRKNPASIAAAVAVHLVVGYALLSGLAFTAIRHIPGVTIVVPVPPDPTPPPPTPDTPRSTKPTPLSPTPKPKPTEESFRPDPLVKLPPVPDFGGPTLGGGDKIEVKPVEPAPPSQAADAVPAKDRLRWITTDDYLASLIRQNVQGLVVISVTIGTDGHVRSCLVTQSSGNRQLDDLTCRLYTQRARFTPARDADGNPTISQRTDRYRWQLPAE